MVCTNKNYSLDSFLKEMYVTDLKSAEKFKSLTEDEKQGISKKLATSLFKSIKEKAIRINYADIDLTDGDITKYSHYNNLKDSINLLQTMYQNDTENAPAEIPRLKRALDIIIKYKNQFRTAFAKHQEVKTLFYINMVAALIGATSFLISVSITYIKDPMGNYKAIFKNTAKNAVEGDIFFKNIDKMISMDMNGQLNKFLSGVDLISETTYITDEFCNKNIENVNEDAGDLLDRFANSRIARTIGIAGLAIAGLFGALFLIKEVVFKFFEIRTKISDELVHLAYFVECNLKKLDPKEGNNAKIIEKQKKMVEKLTRLSEKIAVDNRVANKAAKEANDDDNKKQEEDAKTSDGDILI